MILQAFCIGMVLCALALVLLDAEAQADTPDKFASAATMFAAWCAFGMLLMAGTYGLGIVLPGIAAALVLSLRRLRMPALLTGFAPYKLHLGLGALLASIVAWIGVLNLIEETPYG